MDFTDKKHHVGCFSKWMIQCCARVYRPGCKADAVLLFVGGEGAKKSTFFSNLCPHPEWYLDNLPELGEKDAMAILRGKMIVEMAEMAAGKKDVDKLKAYVTKNDDTYRKAYGIDDRRHPRTISFCATSNDSDCLSNDGGRRWWVVQVPDEHAVSGGTRIDLDRVKREKAQLWGEAASRFKAGEEWWLTYDIERATRAVALTYSGAFEGVSDIQSWLTKPWIEGGPRNRDITSSREVWTRCLGRSDAAYDLAAARTAGRSLKALPGWTHKVCATPGGGSYRFFLRTSSKMHLDTAHRLKYLSTLSPTQQDFTPVELTQPCAKGARSLP